MDDLRKVAPDVAEALERVQAPESKPGYLDAAELEAMAHLMPVTNAKWEAVRDEIGSIQARDLSTLKKHAPELAAELEAVVDRDYFQAASEVHPRMAKRLPAELQDAYERVLPSAVAAQEARRDRETGAFAILALGILGLAIGSPWSMAATIFCVGQHPQFSRNTFRGLQSAVGGILRRLVGARRTPEHYRLQK